MIQSFIDRSEDIMDRGSGFTLESLLSLKIEISNLRGLCGGCEQKFNNQKIVNGAQLHR